MQSFIFSLLLFISLDASSCPMCFQGNGDTEQVVSTYLNTTFVLLGMPFLFLGVGIYLYKKKKKALKSSQPEQQV